MRRLAVLLLVPLALASIAGASRRQDDDAELREFRGRTSFRNNCLMCHTAPLMASQRLTPDQWKAELTKMIGWGAPVPKDEESDLLDYLNRHYGDKVPTVRPDRITVAEAEKAIGLLPDEAGGDLPQRADRRGADLFARHCASCHGKDARGAEGGTNLVARPVLGRPSDYRQVVREGRNRMPGFRAALDREAESAILVWLQAREP